MAKGSETIRPATDTSDSHILIVEDDPVSRDLVAGHLEHAGFRTSEARDGKAMWRVLATGEVDLILLDIRLPGDDGLTLLREIRARSDVGVILVTGQTDELDRLLGLELGADDYVTKPFNMRELLVRIRNLLRRTQALRALRPDGAGEARERRFEGWTLDARRRRLTDPEGEPVRLTRGEFQLLEAFIENPGRVLSRDSLLDRVSGREHAPCDRTIDVMVARLRRKLKDNPSDPAFIVTEHNLGYMFAARVA